MGFMTKVLMDDYLKKVQTLEASENTTEKLYFWQLFSVLGHDGITDIVTKFYKRVLTDPDDDLFRDTFKESGNLEYHVRKQTNFWVDAMGGGKMYPGGEARLELHHDNAKIIMTERGAIRWLHHMRATLDEFEFEDERIKPCLMEFINFMMERYGQQYKFTARL